MRFTEADYQRIYDLTFNDSSYAGYRPNVQEAPNGDGKWDEDKKYAHIATKYFPSPELMTYYARAFEEACRVHRDLDFPRRLSPDWNSCCMRILDYPPGAGSAEHTDFDFFTIQLYREIPEGFVRTGTVAQADESISTGIHFGEMAEVANLRKAMPHYVKEMDVRQKSIVFFVLPNPDVPLITAGEWLAERYARSRR
jgi:hypothetical protein